MAKLAVPKAAGAKASSGNDQVTVVAVDSGSGLVLSNGQGIRAITWGKDPGSIGKLQRPQDVAIDHSGNVAITDTGNRRVVLLRHDGASLRAGKSFAGFQEPRGIAADGRGGFYVCDRGANALVHLDPATGKTTPFGLEVSFDRPIAVATVPEGDKLSRGKRRRVAVVDKDGARLRLLSVEGSVIAGRDASSIDPKATFDDIDIDYFGNVLAVDRAGNRMHKFRDDLFPLDTFGTKGTGRGTFNGPRGIAIQRATGQVFVTESDGGRYLWVGTEVRAFQANAAAEGIAFAYRLTEESTTSLTIRDSAGHTVATIFSGDRQPAGDVRGTWDGTNEKGAAVAAGEYVAEIRARATYSSRSTYEAKKEKSFRWDPGK